MEVLIVYEGGHGRTRKVAELMAKAVEDAGSAATVAPVGEADAAAVADVDALLTGCWVQGRIPFGGKPTRKMADWIRSLPPLAGTPAAAFCTYRFFPLAYSDAVARTAESLQAMQAGLESRGADVVATKTIHPRRADEVAAPLVREVLAAA